MTEALDSRDALTEEILERMSVLIRGIRRNFPTAVDEMDITMRQCRAIMFLGEGPASMSKLANSIGASLPSTTGLVDRLVQRGVVSRHEAPHDRRHPAAHRHRRRRFSRRWISSLYLRCSS